MPYGLGAGLLQAAQAVPLYMRLREMAQQQAMEQERVRLEGERSLREKEAEARQKTYQEAQVAEAKQRGQLTALSQLTEPRVISKQALDLLDPLMREFFTRKQTLPDWEKAVGSGVPGMGGTTPTPPRWETGETELVPPTPPSEQVANIRATAAQAMQHQKEIRIRELAANRDALVAQRNQISERLANARVEEMQARSADRKTTLGIEIGRLALQRDNLDLEITVAEAIRKEKAEERLIDIYGIENRGQGGVPFNVVLQNQMQGGGTPYGTSIPVTPPAGGGQPQPPTGQVQPGTQPLRGERPKVSLPTLDIRRTPSGEGGISEATLRTRAATILTHKGIKPNALHPRDLSKTKTNIDALLEKPGARETLAKVDWRDMKYWGDIK